MGANKNSLLFYNKIKGLMENAVLENKITNTYILRPSLISGARNEKRTLEKTGLLIFKIVQPILIGTLKKYQIINAESIAKAIINLANQKNNSKQIITSHKIKAIAQNN